MVYLFAVEEMKLAFLIFDVERRCQQLMDCSLSTAPMSAAERSVARRRQ